MLGALLRLLSACGGVWPTSPSPPAQPSSASSSAAAAADEGRDGLLWWRDLARCHAGELSVAVVQGNHVLEDQCRVDSSPPLGTCLALFDGHAGPDAARFACDHFIPNLQEAASGTQGVTADAIRDAFLATEEGFLALVSRTWETQPDIATVGTCCLVGVVHRMTLFVANLGDSRAVLGKKVGRAGQITAEQLSSEHNANEEGVRQELMAEHPDDPQIVALKHGVWRVKGIIQVSRSLGDAYLKHTQYNTERIKPKFRLPEPFSKPILSANPSIISHCLQPSDCFIIFASDGLWEHLSNQQAAEIVHSHQRAGSARRLIKAALHEAARKREMRYSDLMKIDKKGSMDGTGAASSDGGAFLEFVDYAISMLSSSSGGDGDESPGAGPAPARPPWGWAVAQVLKSCCAYSSGVTAAILLSDLFQSWTEQRKSLTAKRKVELTNLLKTRNRRRRLPNTITIDSINEKNFLSPKSVIEAVVIDVFVIPGTNIYMLTLGDMWSTSTIDLYLHRRYYNYIGQHGVLKKGREVMLTGCCLRTAMEGSGRTRILPTEYMVMLLDENEDEDAMLLAAQFCTYSFSSMMLDENRNNISYSFFARIEKIESLEPFGSTERKQIVLVDNDDATIKFVLWGEQVFLANLFSVGSMLALDRPFISNCVHNNHESQELCLEYGSATQVYLVPIAQQEEQVLLTPTQIRSQGSRLPCVSSDHMASQVILPRDLHGSVDFSKYPFRVNVSDLHDKMVGVSLFGTVKSVCKANVSGASFYLEIEDSTGVVLTKLKFIELWSLGRICRVRLDHVDVSSLKLHLTIADDSEKVFAWCVGQTAVEFLQISPDEYLELPEDERAMYLYTLQNESFTVAIANTSKQIEEYIEDKKALPVWEITRAQKCE
uniref:protein-serine/threonine phosphatase n=1 Tax=Leersia perrieri TaxID=77586 RepID=A0A0D9W110_9ORYZ